MYRVEIITPPRQGGPFNWASALVDHLNQSQLCHAKHLYNYSDIVSRQFTSSADIIHAAFPYPFRPANKPYVLTVKGDFEIENKFIAHLYRLAIKAADVITVPSLYLKKKLKLTTAIVIPNAVNPSKNLYLARQTIQLITTTNLWFAQKARGVQTMIDILNSVANSTSHQISLTVLGAGAYQSDLTKYAQKHAHFPVKFAGWQDPKKFLAKSDIFLYYSYHDNMPNSILEAQAAGLPIISNQVGAVSEILVDGSGLLANSDLHYQQLLVELINSPSKRLSLSRRAHQVSQDKFSWAKIVGQYQQIYNQLIG